jgi:hypothetical protein
VYWQNPFSASGPYCDSASAGALCVGAVDPPDGTTIANYSNWGPTNDERIKPDLVAPAGFSGFTMNPFGGTSASTPAVAGAAALVVDAGFASLGQGNTGVSDPTMLAQYLLGATVDRGASGPDDIYGNGELVLPPPPRPPAVTITSPQEGEAVSEDVLIVAEVSSERPVTSVVFDVDGVLISTDTSGEDGWTAVWDSRTSPNGPYALTATATDTLGLFDMATVNVVTDNVLIPPTVAITQPQDGQTVSALLNVVAQVSSERPVVSVDFEVDGISIGVDTSGEDGWMVPWDTTGYANGPYTLTATATDDFGFTGSDSVLVIVEHVMDGVALFNPASGEWHLRRPDGSNLAFFYGAPGDVPLLGDWDCDGVDTVAMFRPSNGFIYLRNSNTLGFADEEFFYGIGGDIPLAGDWDGDGCDTFAIYRKGEVFVANTLGTVLAEYSFYYGVRGDRPFAGDFDGDGISSVGLYRESSGFAYIRDSLSSGFANYEFFYGVPSDRIAVGDWDGDGDDSVGIFRPSSARFYLSNENQGGFADVDFGMGEGGWIPAAGHFSFSTAAVGPIVSTFEGPLDTYPWVSGEVSFQVSEDGTEVINPALHLVLTDYHCDGVTISTDGTTTLFTTAPIGGTSFVVDGPPTWLGFFDSETEAWGTVAGEVQLSGGGVCEWGPFRWEATAS